MHFDAALYCELESRFKEQVKKDNESAKSPDGKGVYTPIREPEGPVDFILVAMEPSLKGWAIDLQDAQRQIDEEDFKNLETSPDDKNSALFLFRHSIQRYLCGGGETYLLTDLAKGAMTVAGAAADRHKRYEAWYPLLLEELELVGKPGSPVIAVGRTVENFLKKKGLEKTSGRQLHHVLHYSPVASRYRKTEALRHTGLYSEFGSEPFLNQQSIEYSGLSCSQKHLLFTYKVQFGAIRNPCNPSP